MAHLLSGIECLCCNPEFTYQNLYRPRFSWEDPCLLSGASNWRLRYHCECIPWGLFLDCSLQPVTPTAEPFSWCPMSQASPSRPSLQKEWTAGEQMVHGLSVWSFSHATSWKFTIYMHLYIYIYICRQWVFNHICIIKISTSQHLIFFFIRAHPSWPSHSIRPRRPFTRRLWLTSFWSPMLWKAACRWSIWVRQRLEWSERMMAGVSS